MNIDLPKYKIKLTLKETKVVPDYKKYTSAMALADCDVPKKEETKYTYKIFYSNEQSDVLKYLNYDLDIPNVSIVNVQIYQFDKNDYKLIEENNCGSISKTERSE